MKNGVAVQLDHLAICGNDWSAIEAFLLLVYGQFESGKVNNQGYMRYMPLTVTDRKIVELCYLDTYQLILSD